MRLKPVWLDAIALMVAVLLGGYWQMAGAQFLPPLRLTEWLDKQSDVLFTQAPTGHLTYQPVAYDSSVLGSQRTYGVVLPPGYHQHPNQKYPVIVLLHGGHGTWQDWLLPQKGNALTTLEQLYQTGKLPPSIVITPDGNDKRGSSPYWDPQYFDGPHGKLATALGNELVQVIQHRYRALSDPAFWAIGGLSSGGWGALNIGLHYPQHFSVLFSHSGYFVDRSGPQNSPLHVVQQLSAGDRHQLRIYLDTGTVDQRYLSQAKKFHRALDQLHVANLFQVFPGAHSWSFWRQHLADSLAYVGQQFQAAQGTAAGLGAPAAAQPEGDRR